jgi:hypothetical protein
VTHYCLLDKITDPNDSGSTISGVEYGSSAFLLGDLSPGETKSLSCEKIVKGFHGEPAITIRIVYSRWPWIHHQRNKFFPFESEQADDGSWAWKAK